MSESEGRRERERGQEWEEGWKTRVDEEREGRGGGGEDGVTSRGGGVVLLG